MVLMLRKWFYIKLSVIYWLLLFSNRMPIIKGNNMTESKEFMNGKVLRVAVLHYPPAICINQQPDGTVNYSGSSIEVIKYAEEALNISIEFVPISLADVKKFGAGPAQLNAILNNKADVSILGVVLSYQKYLIVDLSIPLMIQPYHIVVPWPVERNRLLVPLRPFQPLVWISLGLSFIGLIFALSFLTGFDRNYLTGNQLSNNRRVLGFANILHNGTFLLSHLIHQRYYYNLRLRSRGSWILVGIWCLMCVVLANAYAGVLFSFLSVAKLEPIVKSLEELANAKQLKLIVQDRSELANRYLNATNGIEKVIGDSLRDNPQTLMDNILDAKKKLLTGHYALANFDLFNYGLIAETYRENGKKCRLTLAKETISFFAPIVFVFAKNGPFTKAIDEQILAQMEYGLFVLYKRKIMPRIDQCLMENQNKASSHVKPLSLVDMSSAFFILALGLSVAFLVFLLELIYKRIKDHYYDEITDTVLMCTKKTVLCSLTPPDGNNRVMPRTPIEGLVEICGLDLSNI